MNISVAIMATFERREHAQALRDKLFAMPFTEVEIIYDDNVEGDEWSTGKRALEHGIGKADWHLVLQDDAIVGNNFYINVANAIFMVPEDNLISLYLGTVRPYKTQVKQAFNRAFINGSSWISASTLLWGVGIAVPTNDILLILENAENVPTMMYDRRIGNYYFKNKRKVYYTTMSLVQHNHILPSLIGNDKGNSHRVAHHFVGDTLVTYNSRCISL